MAARNDLAATGKAGASAALEALARESDPQRRAALVTAIELMHPLVDRPLLAMLATDDPELRADVAMLLERLAVPQAAPLLAADSQAAERAVATAISNLKRGVPPFEADSNNQVEFWRWDDATKSLAVARLPADEAQIAWISRLADERARLRRDSPEAQLRALVLRLEMSGLIGAKSNASPIDPAALARADPRELNAALAVALESNYGHAARTLADALGASRDLSVLATADGKPSPLVDALNSPDRRVRFAALGAIMALDPAAPYPGASRVPDALAWFAGGAGERQAVVAMPTMAAAGDLAGELAAHNLVAAPANSGRDAVAMAREMPDLELILIDANTIVPDIRQSLYELRINPTTGDIPIALLAADGRLEGAKRLAAEHTRVIAVPRPHTPEALAGIVANLARLGARDLVPADLRAAEADQASKWLVAISDGSRPFYTFRRTRLWTPASARPLGAIPTPAAPAPEAVPVP
jgi:CheY-like chemotaxis protein